MLYNKYILVSKKFGPQKRGAFIKGERLSSLLNIEHIQPNSLTKEIFYSTKIKILLSQNVSYYNYPLTNNNSLRVFVKKRIPGVSECFSDGFSHAKLKNLTFVPTITTFKTHNHPKDETIGFYCRPHIFPDSYLSFLSLLKHSSSKFHIFTMGYLSQDLKRFPSVLSHTHTTSNVVFFSNITHLYYPQTRFVDTFPNTLLEAFQNNIQVVSPFLKGRSHRDGIDDILSFTNYHKCLKFSVRLDNKDFPLTFENFSPFYNELFSNDFRYPYDSSLNSLKEWMVKYL